MSQQIADELGHRFEALPGRSLDRVQRLIGSGTFEPYLEILRHRAVRAPAVEQITQQAVDLHRLGLDQIAIVKQLVIIRPFELQNFDGVLNWTDRVSQFMG